MAAHRYWRVTITASTAGPSNLISPYAMELRATAGGADQCYGGTSSASHSTTNVYKLFDHNNSSYYNNGSPGVTCWVQYDMGVGNDIEVFELWFLPRYSSQMPKDFTLEYSDDGSAFTVLQSWTGEESWQSGVGKAFALPGMPVAIQWSLNFDMPEPADPNAIARYWRIHVTETVSTNHSYYEIEMRATSGGTDLCSGGTASASHNNSTAYKAFNDNGGDYWISGVSGVDQWIQYDFGAGNEVNVKEIALKPREWYYAPKNFSLQYSLNGTDYLTVAEWSNVTEGWSPWEWAAFKVPGPVAKADWGLPFSIIQSVGWSLPFDDAPILVKQWAQPYQIGIYADRLWDFPYAVELSIGWALPFGDKVFYNAQWSLPYGLQVSRQWSTPFSQSADRHWDLTYGLQVDEDWTLRWQRFLGRSWDLPLHDSISRGWNIPWSLNHVHAGQWSLPFTQTHTIFLQWPLPEDLLPLNRATRQWQCFWDLSPIPASNRLAIDAFLQHHGSRIALLSAEIGIAEGEYAWTGRAELADAAAFQSLAVNDAVELVLGNQTYALIIDNRTLSRDGTNRPTMMVSLISPTANLAQPRAVPMEKSWDTTIQARTTAEETVGQSVVWDLIDWQIPAGRLAFYGAAPLDILQSVASAAGGVVETLPDGSLRVRHRFPVSVPEWSHTTPDLVLTDAADNLSVRESFLFRSRVNRIAIREFQPQFGSLTASLDDREEGGLNPDGQATMLPSSSPGFLVHSGPDIVISGVNTSAGTVTPQANQVYLEEVDVIFNGTSQARLSKPAKSIDSWIWLGNDLGQLTLGTDGVTLTSESIGVAIARITYTVRAAAWRLNAPTSLAGSTSFPIQVQVTGDAGNIEGSEEIIFQRGAGEFEGPSIIEPILTGFLAKQSRARAEIDSGEALQEVSLTCIFQSTTMPGQLAEIHNAMMGATWRGKITAVRHTIQGPMVITALDLVRHVAVQ